MTGGPVLIRDACPTDHALGHIGLYTQLTDAPPMPLEQYTAFLKAHSETGGCVLVAEVDGQLMGCATLLVEQKLIHGGRPVGHIEDVVVDQAARGQGVGKALIEALVQRGKKAKCYKVILDCSEHNTGFYDRCGLERKGVCMGVYL
ncbi:hypothetical protein KIPB_010712 [Kipferlia bialata]|uniref:Glucosamine 6-phosphate N-acetyltransferase n=1 Tax=Kipferlia bialata TaxID=797122 RepID=A0A9K3D5I4_9EUKA|nr:hypothetical protein KIPB_010712 [Kipferlia bialata]|eukprot:g10712.t1